MPTTPHHDDLTALRALDAAPAVRLDDTQQRRAHARLQQILATDPAAAPAGAVRPPGRSAPVRRGLLTAAAVAVVAAAVAAPDVLGADAAYASWTPVPASTTPADRAVVDAACRDTDLGLDSPGLALAERRGDWVTLLYTGTHPAGEPAATSCLAHLPVGGRDARDVDVATAGGQGAVPGAGQLTQGPIMELADRSVLGLGTRPRISVTLGDVGSDVTAVSIGTADGQSVEATVSGGRYVAWWPGEAFGDGTEGNGGPAPALTYRVTLADGTVLDDVVPTSPR